MRRIDAAAALIVLAAALSAGCAPQRLQSPPFKPVANVDQLMDGVLAPAADAYWRAVSIVVDESGVSENFPETDEEWERVWAAGIALAESGNLLMMAPRAVNEPDWMRMSGALVDVGAEAAAAALTRDPEAVLDVGERIYSVCLDCHDQYVVDIVD